MQGGIGLNNFTSMVFILLLIERVSSRKGEKNTLGMKKLLVCSRLCLRLWSESLSTHISWLLCLGIIFFFNLLVSS